jgi:hypothetical protein
VHVLAHSCRSIARVRYRIMSSRDDHEPVHRLRVPAALAVAFVGSSAAVAMWYGGCTPDEPEPNPDAGNVQVVKDAEDIDSLDAEAPSDAPVDAAVDAPPDTPPV